MFISPLGHKVRNLLNHLMVSFSDEILVFLMHQRMSVSCKYLPVALNLRKVNSLGTFLSWLISPAFRKAIILTKRSLLNYGFKLSYKIAACYCKRCLCYWYRYTHQTSWEIDRIKWVLGKGEMSIPIPILTLPNSCHFKEILIPPLLSIYFKFGQSVFGQCAFQMNLSMTVLLSSCVMASRTILFCVCLRLIIN